MELPEPHRDKFRADPYPTLEDWLEIALPRLGERRVLLNFDEFERLGYEIAQGRLSVRVLDQLRHLIQHYGQLGFLFSGLQTWDAFGPSWNSYFISVVPVEMLYLEPPEAAKVLTEPDPAFDLRYEEGLVDHIVTLTRGQPFLLQLLGENLVLHANQRQTRLATPELLKAAIESAFNAGGLPYFNYLWNVGHDEITPVPPDEIAAGQRAMKTVALGQSISAQDEPATQAALKRLVKSHIFERVGDSPQLGYQFEIPLVARWVKERGLLE